MKSSLRKLLITGLISAMGFTAAQAVAAGPSTINIEKTMVSDAAFDGYTLFSPKNSKQTYLIDNSGDVVHQWQSEFTAGTNAYLLENGNLLRAGSVGFDGNKNIHTPFAGGIIEEFDWQGNLVWQFEYNTDKVLQHHFIEPMPNGNVLMLAYEYFSKEEAIAAGRDPSKLADGYLTPEHVVEVKKTGKNSGEIVWEWHAFDHLVQDFDKSKPNFGVVSEHPEKININYTPPGPSPTGADWNHAANASYNAVTDQVVIAVAGFNEVWVIDHNTTTEEAKGAKGDLVFRWGNPQAYGVEGDFMLDGPHNAEILDDGRVAVINYGRSKDKFSSIVFIEPGASTTEAANTTKSFSDGKLMYSGFEFLPNGNALITAVGGKLLEMTESGEVLWQYYNRDTGKGMLNVGDAVPMWPAIPGQEMPKFPANYLLTSAKYSKADLPK